jgi:hypothetical protein
MIVKSGALAGMAEVLDLKDNQQHWRGSMKALRSHPRSGLGRLLDRRARCVWN